LGNAQSINPSKWGQENNSGDVITRRTKKAKGIDQKVKKTNTCDGQKLEKRKSEEEREHGGWFEQNPT